MERLELAPIFDRYMVYNDHYDGELIGLGDALGRDCMVASFNSDAPYYMRLYRTDGAENEDWFSWNAKVYAPISGTVTFLRECKKTNQPGTFSPDPPAAVIIIKAEDGTQVFLAHIQNPLASKGEQVQEGEHIAYVGNNGYARCPHIHIGAYRDNQPLAIGFDPKKVAKMRQSVSEAHWCFGEDTE